MIFRSYVTVQVSKARLEITSQRTNRVGTLEDASEHASVGSVYAQLAAKQPFQILNSRFTFHCCG